MIQVFVDLRKQVKGYRKLFVFGFSLIWATILPLLVPDSALIPAYSFAGTVIGGFYAANWGEHKEAR